MSRRKRISKQSQTICAQVHDEIARSRQERSLSNVVFAFPRVMTQGKWHDPSGLIVASVVKRRKMPQSSGDVRAFPIALEGVAAVEFPVNHEWMKKLREIGCLVVEKSKPNARVKVPGDIADFLDTQTIAVVDVPPFHLGMTWNWPVIEALQGTAERVSEERARDQTVQ